MPSDTLPAPTPVASRDCTYIYYIDAPLDRAYPYKSHRALKEALPMERFLVCNNPKCHFVLDRHINGTSLDDAQLILKKCPACGGDWSSTCPACAHPLTVKLVGGLPFSVCCERKPATRARAA